MPFPKEGTMKHLSDYMSERQTATFEKYGVFFAFSRKQIDEGRKEGIQYQHVGHGMIVPKEHVEVVMKELDEIYQDGIKQDLAENGKEAIIKRELNNYECYCTGAIGNAFEALADYGITYDDVMAVYKGVRNEK